MGTMLPYIRPVSPAAHLEKHAPLQRELAAMNAIAQAMAELPEEARARVVQWTIDAFHVRAVDPSTAAVAISAPAAVTDGDGMLQVDDLREFFQLRPPSGAKTPAEQPRTARREPDALAVSDEDLFWGSAKAVVPQRLPVADDRDAADDRDDGEQPVVSMIHGFVEDFQRLARAWETESEGDERC